MTCTLKKLIIIIMLLLSCTAAYAQPQQSVLGDAYDYSTLTQQQSSVQPQNITHSTVQKSAIEYNLQYVMITAGLYCFSLIIIAVLMKLTPDHQAKDLVTIVGLVSVIFGMLLLVLVVDTDEALTAPMGIMGAIAGYLFGTAQKKERLKED